MSNQSRVVDRNDLRCTAFHEAGHAVAAIKLKIDFEKVFILVDRDPSKMKDGALLGQVVRNFHLPSLAGQGEDVARCQVAQALAGPIAEILAYPGLALDMPQNHPDVANAGDLLAFTFCSFKQNGKTIDWDKQDRIQKKSLVERIFQEGLHTASRVVDENREAIARVADALLKKGELLRDEVLSLCDAPTDQSSTA